MKKGALGLGGNYGRGCLLCRLKDKWSSPVMISMTGGSFGFQIGGSSTDVILLIMNAHGVNKLLESKVTLGGEIDEGVLLFEGGEVPKSARKLIRLLEKYDTEGRPK